MRTTADHDRFAALAREAEAILADQVVFIPLLARAAVSAVWADEIAGYGYPPGSTLGHRNLGARVGLGLPVGTRLPQPGRPPRLRGDAASGRKELP